MFYLTLIIKCNYILNLSSCEVCKMCGALKPSSKTMFKLLGAMPEECPHFASFHAIGLCLFVVVV